MARKRPAAPAFWAITLVSAALLALAVLGAPTLSFAVRTIAGGDASQSVGIKSRLAKMSDALSKIKSRLLSVLLALSFVRYALFAALNVGILMLLVPGLDPLFLAISYPLILFLMAIPIFPGGLGVVEATWSGLLISQGIDAAAAVEASIALRIISTAGFFVIAPVLVFLRSQVDEGTS